MSRPRNFWELRRLVHEYTVFPQSSDIPGETSKFKSFRKFIIELFGVGVAHFVAKATNPIKDSDIKDRELERMKETAQAAALIEEREEIINPIEDVPFEEILDEEERLIEDLISLAEALRLKYGVVIQVSTEEKGLEDVSANVILGAMGMASNTIEIESADQEKKRTFLERIRRKTKRYISENRFLPDEGDED